MEFREYVRVLRKRWLTVALIAGLVTGGAAAATFLQAPTYSSDVRLFVSTSETSDGALLQGSQFSAQRVKSYSDLVTSRDLANQVAQDLGPDVNPAELPSKVEAEVAPDTVNLTITVTDSSPQEAQRIAQAYAEQLVDMIRELETPPGEKSAPVKATIVDSASFSDDPVAPQPARAIALGLFVGLVLGIGVALLRHTLDTRITSTEEVAELADAPVLGAIATDPSVRDHPLISSLPSHAPRSESFGSAARTGDSFG